MCGGPRGVVLRNATRDGLHELPHKLEALMRSELRRQGDIAVHLLQTEYLRCRARNEMHAQALRQDPGVSAATDHALL
jgi:hypothetical protein